MKSITNGIINVHVDPKDKEETSILKDLGLNMTLKQPIPFEISNHSYSDELENAIKESKLIEKEHKEGKRKGYNNTNEMMKSILND